MRIHVFYINTTKEISNLKKNCKNPSKAQASELNEKGKIK